MLAEEGAHERVAQQLAGHADSRTTRDLYTHVTGAMLAGAAEAIELSADSLHRAGSGMGPGTGIGDADGESAGGV